LTLLGLHVRDHSTLAVLVDEAGRVLSEQSHETGGALAAARAASAGTTVEGAGIAADLAVDVDAVAAAVGCRTSQVTAGGGIALAEQWCGAAKGARHVVALSLTDTVHAGIVVDGRLFAGAHGQAAAAAWLALNPVEREDYRRLGCLGAEVGGAGIVRRLVWRIKAGDHSRVLEMAGGNLAAITAGQVFEAARAGDGVANSVVRDTAKYIGMAVANLIAIVDPEVIVLGGAIADARDLLLEPTRAELVRRMPPSISQQVSLVPAALGEAAAAIGAARAAMLAAG